MDRIPRLVRGLGLPAQGVVVTSRGASRESVDVSPELTLAEVKEHWTFLGGSFMALDVRRHLHRARGFCPRHAWTLLATEFEYRWGPFHCAILYEDLTRQMALALANPLRRAAAPLILRPWSSCFTCDFIAFAGPDPAYGEILDAVNAMEKLRAYLEETAVEWRARTCPSCAGGSGIPCRKHLRAGIPLPNDLARGLSAIADRARTFVKSMTWRGPAATCADRVALLEAIGWFSGCDFVLGLQPLADPDARAGEDEPDQYASDQVQE